MRDKEGAKKLLRPYVGLGDREALEATWQYANDTPERISHPDPEGMKVVIHDRSRARPEVGKLSPEQFIDGSIIRELEREGFLKTFSSGNRA